MNKEEELKKVQKDIILIQLITAPANIAIGLGLYGVFAVTDNNAFISILNNIEFCYGLIVVGVVIEILAFKKLRPLLQRQAVLKDS